MSQLWRPKTNGPVHVVEVKPENRDELERFCGGAIITEHDPEDHSKTYIGVNVPTLDGVVRASEGDFIVRSEAGRYTVVPREEFLAQYERAGVRRP